MTADDPDRRVDQLAWLSRAAYRKYRLVQMAIGLLGTSPVVGLAAALATQVFI